MTANLFCTLLTHKRDLNKIRSCDTAGATSTLGRLLNLNAHIYALFIKKINEAETKNTTLHGGLSNA